MKSTGATQASSWKLKSVKGGGMGVILYLSTMIATAGWIQFIPSHTISLITTVKLSSQIHLYFQSTLCPSGVPIKIWKCLSNLHVSYVTSILFTSILSLWYVTRATNISSCIFLYLPITFLHYIPKFSSVLSPQITYNHVCPWQGNTLPTHIKQDKIILLKYFIL
jgi:hypothetical protein